MSAGENRKTITKMKNSFIARDEEIPLRIIECNDTVFFEINERYQTK